MIFKGAILGGVRKFHMDSYLNGTTVPFDYGHEVDCSIRASRSFQPFLCLHCLGVVSKRCLHRTTRKNYDFALIIPRTHPIISQFFPLSIIPKIILA